MKHRFLFAWLLAAASAAASLPRADLDGNGRVDLADYAILQAELDAPRPTPTPSPTPEPMRQLIEHLGPADSCAYDIRSAGRTLELLEIRSNQHGVMADDVWAAARNLTIRDCWIRSVGYGVYSEIPGLRIVGGRIDAARRAPLRIAGGTDIVIEGLTIGPAEIDAETGIMAAVSVRVHDAQRVIFRDCKFYATNPWGCDVAEQDPNVGTTVGHVLFERCQFYAVPQTRCAVRVRGPDVTVRECEGFNFSPAAEGFVVVERANIDPARCVVERCKVDANIPIVRRKWDDTK